MNNTIQNWSGNETDCPEKDGMPITSDSLKLDSFKGLFLIAGLSASSALLIFFLVFLYQNREILATDDSIWQKLTAIAKVFDDEKEKPNSKSEKPGEGNESQKTTPFTASAASPEILPNFPSQSPETRIALPPDEGFSTTEPGTTLEETITEENEER